MDLSLLIPFLSKTAAAGLSVSPEEVVIQLKKDQSKKDKQNETVDSDIIDHDQMKSINKNIEGKLMDSSFKELDVQAAVEKAVDQKKKGLSSDSSKPCCDSTKTASYWDLLSSRFKK